MARIFPEDMDRLDPNNVAQSLRTIEDYIRYITERVEFNAINTKSQTQLELDALRARIEGLKKESE